MDSGHILTVTANETTNGTIGGTSNARDPSPGTPAVLLAALAQLTEGVIVADADGAITFVNEAAARLHGVVALHVGPAAYTDTYHLLTVDGEPYPSTELPLARAVIRGETVVDARWRIRHPDGREVPVVGSAHPVLGPDGARMGAVLTVRDDSAHHAAVSARRERDALSERLRAAFDQSPTSTVVYDAAGRLLAVNPAFERLWGATMADVPPGYSVLDDPQLVAAGVQPMLRRAFAGETVTLPPLRYAMPESVAGGRVRWTQAHLYPVHDASGALHEVVLTHEDVTDRQQADEVRASATARAEQLQALSAALSRASSLDEVAQAVVVQSTAVLAAVGTVIALVSPDGASVEILGAGAMPDTVRDEWRRFALDAPVPLAEVARTGTAMFLESRAQWAERYPALVPLLQATGQHANAVLPLVVDDRVLGVLGAAFDTPRTFGADERALAQAVALQCAQALERARLLESERMARAAAESAEARLRAIFEQAPVAVAVMEGPRARLHDRQPALRGEPRRRTPAARPRRARGVPGGRRAGLPRHDGGRVRDRRAVLRVRAAGRRGAAPRRAARGALVQRRLPAAARRDGARVRDRERELRRHRAGAVRAARWRSRVRRRRRRARRPRRRTGPRASSSRSCARAAHAAQRDRRLRGAAGDGHPRAGHRAAARGPRAASRRASGTCSASSTRC